MIDDHLTEWFGLPVKDFTPDAPLEAKGAIYRFAYSYDAEDDFDLEKIEEILSSPEAAEIQALVFGMPGESDESFDDVKELLIRCADHLTGLRGLFLGDVLQEENEMSWIQQTDAGEILAAFPGLEELRTRGGSDLKFTPCHHIGLTKLIMETGGMPKTVLAGLTECVFPELEHLELWLGTDEYGWDGTLEDVLPLIEPGRFPKLKYLGLRNSEIANDLANALADAPVLDQLEELDFSGGTTTDEGAAALLNSGRVKRLKKLNLHNNYLSGEIAEKFGDLGPEVDVSEQREPDSWDGENHYYVAVGE